MMRRILAMVRLDLLLLLRNPLQLLSLLALPMVLTMLLGSMGGSAAENTVPVAFVDEDGSAYSARVSELMDADASVEIEVMSREDAQQRVADGSAPAALIVEKGFGDDLERGEASILTYSDPASDRAYAVIAVAQGVATRLSADAAASGIITTAGADFSAGFAAADALWDPTPPVDVVEEEVRAAGVLGDSVQASVSMQSSAGFLLYFLLFSTFGGAGAILEDREIGTLRRLLVTPSSRMTLTMGKIAGIAVIAGVQAIILVVFGQLAIGVPWVDHLGAVALVLGSYVLAATGIAVLLSTLVRSRDQYSGASPVISTGLAMLGGCFWSLDIVSPTMKTIAKFTPTGWGMTALTDILARNHGIEAAILPSAVLLGIAVVTLVIGASQLKFE